MTLQFNDATNLKGLKQDMYFLLGSDNGTAPDDYSTNDQNRNINLWYRKAVIQILRSIAGWEFSDTTATADLAADTNTYQLSAGAGLNISAISLIKIQEVMVSYNDGTNYYKARPVSYADFSFSSDDSNFESNAGLSDQTNPVYILRDDNIDIYPTPSAASTNGIKIHYVTDVTDMSSDGDYPDVPSIFHRYISLGAAYDYAFSRGLPTAGSLRQEIEIYAQELKEFLTTRNLDERFIATPANMSNYEN